MVRPTHNHIFVELHVPNFAPVKDFYTKLGFVIVWESPNYLVMRLADNILGFYQGGNPYFSQFASTTPHGYGVELTIQIIDNIQPYYSKIKPLLPPHSLVSELSHIQYQTSRKWEFRIIDPFGYYLHFTEPVNYLLP